MKEVVAAILEWIERIVPGLLLAFGYGYNKGSDDKKKVENELKLKELELEKKKNAEIIEKINRGLPSNSIIRRAIDRGRKIIRGEE